MSLHELPQSWFPRDESVAMGVLGYALEGPGGFTLEDIVFQLGCNASTAIGAVRQLRKCGYLRERRADDRIAMKNERWGRNVLHPTAKGRAAFERHEKQQVKVPG